MNTPNTPDQAWAMTGFDLPKPHVLSTAPPNPPGNVRLRHGDNPEEVVPMCNPVVGARVYEVQWTLDPNAGPWNNGGTFPSSREMKLTDLPRGKDVWVRIRMQDTRDPSAWGDPAPIMVT
jgi:hypothetical protein